MHHLTDPELARMIDAARGEANAERRLAMYGEIQRKIVADQPEIWGMLANRRWGIRDYVKGFVFCPLRLTGELDLYTLWVDAR
jgi:peptide/nickel transport system substrate-binding protein